MTNKTAKRIAVLMGGMSAERDVSLVSGQSVADALTQDGFDVTQIDAGRNLAAQLAKANPDIIFNALHGEWGEDGRVQGVLDLFGRPYTHSGVMASALAMDKHRAKTVCKAAGINVPQGKLVAREIAAKQHVLKPPYVIKPNAQGSSVGVYLIPEGANRPPVEMAKNDKMGGYVLVENFAPGRELTASVMGGKALCVTEIIAHTAFYDYEAKYADGGSSHIVPAKISKIAAETCMEWAVAAHNALGCQGLTRSDFRFDDEDLDKNAKKSRHSKQNRNA